ncbi:hypothetical protein [Plantactinospora soyae]|uniref:Uncharacterized protein n=1 Tax=Plantactinospora soyae TaxID=1544732 RepID=A0A927R3K7_9ACTN|nr:hypothetical protein [Plantactinospora soyae]MBE1485594.1 hypothetical protein [Plantactinospora soyae]
MSLDLLGLIIDSVVGVAGIAGLLVAVRAYRVAGESYRVSKGQARNNFQIEILRELILLLDGDAELDTQLAGDHWYVSPKLSSIKLRLSLLPKNELPVWRVVFCGGRYELSGPYKSPTDLRYFDTDWPRMRDMVVDSFMKAYHSRYGSDKLEEFVLGNPDGWESSAAIVRTILNKEILDAVERRS